MKRLLLVLATLVLAPLATVCVAQPSEWRITPYLWIPGVDGTLGTFGTGSGLAGRVDVDTSGLSDSLRLGGAMVHATWRSGRWSAFGDWTYANVKADTATPFTTLYSGVDVKVKGNIVEAYGGYELLGARDSHLDVFGGIRYYDLELGLGLREAALPGVLLTSDSNWVDGVVGVRWDTRFAGNWEAFASADVGGGGSDVSWQLFGGVGYQFGWGSVVGGWRHLHVDYEKSGFKLDAAISVHSSARRSSSDDAGRSILEGGTVGRNVSLMMLVGALLAATPGWAQGKPSDATDMQALQAAVRADKRGYVASTLGAERRRGHEVLADLRHVSASARVGQPSANRGARRRGGARPDHRRPPCQERRKGAGRGGRRGAQGAAHASRSGDEGVACAEGDPLPATGVEDPRGAGLRPGDDDTVDQAVRRPGRVQSRARDAGLLRFSPNCFLRERASARQMLGMRNDGTGPGSSSSRCSRAPEQPVRSLPQLTSQRTPLLPSSRSPLAPKRSVIWCRDCPTRRFANF